MEEGLERLYELLDLQGVTTHRVKPNYTYGQIRKRLTEIGLKSVVEYLVVLEKFRDEELPILLHYCTIHTTRFFREAGHFDHLREHCAKLDRVRIWIAACSSGEEAYSAAMTLVADGKKVEILATDLDRKSVERGSNGVYSATGLDDIPRRHHSKHLELDRANPHQFFKIPDALHGSIQWDVANLLSLESHPKWQDWRGSFDVIFCRNVFIYFSEDQIIQATRSLRRALKNSGVLFLGYSERLPARLTSEIGLVVGTHSAYRAIQVSEKKTAALAQQISVMLVDDSKTMLSFIDRQLSARAGIQVIARAENGVEAMKLLGAGAKPQVIVTDMMMPEMDGPTLIAEQMPKFGVPTLVMSALSPDEIDSALKALDVGAFDYFEKPKTQDAWTRCLDLLTAAIHAAAGARGRLGKSVQSSPHATIRSNNPTSLLLIGSSTGGPEALRSFISSLGAECPATVIAQHMPPLFTHTFARRLNEFTQAEVLEGTDGMEVRPGRVILCPGGMRTGFIRRLGRVVLQVSPAVESDKFSPSVDYLFRSAAELDLRSPLIAGLLTGMGSDGAEGLALLRQNGARTFGQNEETSIVFGMAKRAWEGGAIERLLALQDIPAYLAETLFELDRQAKKNAA